MLRKLLKILAIAVGVLAALLLIFVWAVLGVNPLEGPIGGLHELVDSQVDFYVRFPGSRVLNEPLVEGLADEPGYYALDDLRLELARIARDVAREVNPRIPLGLLEVDVEEDFLGREMAFAGDMSDVRGRKLDRFLVLTRVAFYGRFVSALERGFVRSAAGLEDRVEVRRGLYLKMTLPPETVEALRPYRALTPQRLGAENVVYVARIADVLLVSDDDQMIENALARSAATLPALAEFETVFLRNARGGERVETYMSARLTRAMLQAFGRRGEGPQPLAPLETVLPYDMGGHFMLGAQAREDGAVALSFENLPYGGNFTKMAPPLQRIYDQEKGDPAFDLSENGIGRFIPRERTVAAIVLHADPKDVAELIVRELPRDDLQVLDDAVRDRSGSRYTSLQQMLLKLVEDLAETHLLILHRPSFFETVDFSTYYGADPDLKLSYTIVSRVKDSVPADAVRQKLTQHLPFLGVELLPADPALGFSRGTFQAVQLLEPSYGVVPGQRYVVFSTLPENVAAVFAAAGDPAKRLVQTADFAKVVGELPRTASLAAIVDMRALHAHMKDYTRRVAGDMVNLPGFYEDLAKEQQAAGKDPDAEEQTAARLAAGDGYVAMRYPEAKEEYERSLQWLLPLRAAGVAMELGVGAERRVRGEGLVTFALEELERAATAADVGGRGAPVDAE